MAIKTEKSTHSLLFYFSGTGNSRFIAESVRDGLQLENEPVRLIDLADGWDNMNIDASRVGFIFPLYYYGLPSVVRRFLEKVNFASETYLFALITAIYPDGIALEQVNSILGQKNRRLSYGHYLTMPGNFVLSMTIDSEDRQIKKISKAQKKIPSICEDLKKSKIRVQKEKALYHLAMNCRDKYEKWYGQLRSVDNSFQVKQNCSNCGYCEKVCPVGNISLESGQPKWNHLCEFCLRCLHYCPMNAINYGVETEGKLRYKRFRSLYI